MRRARPHCAATFALIALLLAAPPAAADGSEGLFIGFENDVFTGTDNHYSSGLRGEYAGAPGEIPALVQPLKQALSPIVGEGARWRALWGAGHAIFTPTDISISRPSAEERPYAGLLYGYFGLAAESETTLDVFRAEIGVLGPPSLAEPVQKRLHSTIGSPKPQGWDTQIEAQPAFGLAYQHVGRYALEPESEVGGAPLRFEALPHVRVAAGNVDAYAAAGLTFRFGQNYARDFGPAVKRRGASGAAVATPAEGFGWSVFVGVEGRAIARAGLIEGPIFDQRRVAQPERLTGDLSFGLTLSHGPVELGYTHVIETKQYRAQPHTNPFGSHQFGVATLRVSF